MESFELFFEKHMPPVEVLKKYKDNPNAFINFSNAMEPRGMKPSNVSKETTKLGLNPWYFKDYDTPAGIYFFPVQALWDEIKDYIIPFAKDRRYVYVVEPKNPERVARQSTYSEKDFQRDLEKLDEIFPSYNVSNMVPSSHDSYGRTPLRKFWTTTRSLAYAINSKWGEPLATVAWTQIMRRFYDGIVDDQGIGIIHGNEPTQAVFWNSSYINVVDMMDRSHGGKYSSINYHSSKAWERGPSTYSPFDKSEVFEVVKNAFWTGDISTIPKKIFQQIEKTREYRWMVSAKNGKLDQEFLDSSSVPRKAKNFIYELFFENIDIETHEPFLTQENYHNIPPPIIQLYPVKTIMLSKELNDYTYDAYQKIVETDKNTLVNPVLVEKILKLINESKRENSYAMSFLTDVVYNTFEHSKPAHDRVFYSMLSIWEKTNKKTTSSYIDERMWLVALKHLIDEISKSQDDSLWNELFPSFGNYNISQTNLNRGLEYFIKKCNDHVTIEKLKEYLYTETSDVRLLSRDYDNIFFKYFGTMPFNNPSKEKTKDIGKFRHIKKGDFVLSTGGKYYMSINDSSNPQDVVRCIDELGYEYNINAYQLKKAFPPPEILEKFKQNKLFVPGGLSQKHLLKMGEQEEFKRGDIILHEPDNQIYWVAKDTTPNIMKIALSNKDHNGIKDSFKYLCDKIKGINYRITDKVEDENGNVYTAHQVSSEGDLHVIPLGSPTGYSKQGGLIDDYVKHDPKNSIHKKLLKQRVETEPGTWQRITNDNYGSGKIVRCVNTSGNSSILTLGELYLTLTDKLSMLGGRRYLHIMSDDNMVESFRAELFEIHAPEQNKQKYTGDKNYADWKAGDIVTYVSEELDGVFYGKKFKIIYTSVKSAHPNDVPIGLFLLEVEDDNGEVKEYYAKRFIRNVSSTTTETALPYKEWKVGDIVKCVNAPDYTELLSNGYVGKISKIKWETAENSEEVKAGDFIIYIDDIEEGFFAKRFEWVSRSTDNETTTETPVNVFKKGDPIIYKSFGFEYKGTFERYDSVDTGIAYASFGGNIIAVDVQGLSPDPDSKKETFMKGDPILYNTNDDEWVSGIFKKYHDTNGYSIISTSSTGDFDFSVETSSIKLDPYNPKI